MIIKVPVLLLKMILISKALKKKPTKKVINKVELTINLLPWKNTLLVKKLEVEELLLLVDLPKLILLNKEKSMRKTSLLIIQMVLLVFLNKIIILKVLQLNQTEMLLAQLVVLCHHLMINPRIQPLVHPSTRTKILTTLVCLQRVVMLRM